MFQPPEKLYYSIDEVKSEWALKSNVSDQAFDQYLNFPSILRTAIEKPFSFMSCIKITNKTRALIDFYLSWETLSDTNKNFNLPVNNLIENAYKLSKESYAGFILGDLLELPPFLYQSTSVLISNKQYENGYREAIMTFEDFSGDNFLMVDKEWNAGDITTSFSTKIIPAEEKNRFEEKYSQQSKKGTHASDEPSTKTKNAYLRTIYALSNALIDGLTGQHHKDAETILFALSFNPDGDEDEGAEPPVTSKTLAAYLRDAKKLDEKQ